MTDKRCKQFSAAEGAGRTLGAQIEQDGITFSAVVPRGERASLILYPKGCQEPVQEIPFPGESVTGMVRSLKVLGLTPDGYEYNFRIGNQIKKDPAARLVSGTEDFGNLTPGEEHQTRCGFLTKSFDWGGDQFPALPYQDLILYQLHVRGFTKQKNSRVRHKGTFLGLQEKIPYLKDLGINQVLLLPAYEFQEAMKYSAIGAESRQEWKLNYWGFTGDCCYYAPKSAYCAGKFPDLEFKSMVKAFHENGMEVAMEFCFPDPVDVSMVCDCLAWWVREYHVDGFRLFMNQEAANTVARSPFLTGVKLISWYFPAEQIYGMETGFPEKFLAECNENFQVTARRLLKGDENQLEQFVSRVRHNPKNSGVINYITGHDGFTLMDLVSYDRKYNETNGEQGRDGSECNYSWNCGVEGPSRKKKIARLRMQQMKNAFAMVLLSQGTPMLLAGDEFGNSQEGNNNPYCHDSELTWVDWSRERAYGELREFVKELIAFRKAHRILHMDQELAGSDLRSLGYPDFSCHGTRAWYGDFEYSSRHVGLLYCGLYAGEEEFIYIAYNFHWEPKEMALPFLPEGMGWKIVLDTADRDEKDGSLPKTLEAQAKFFRMPPRCVQILIGSKEMEKVSGENK